jgi:hypothetical protein
METLLRLVIVLPGLPAPIPQAQIFDSDGGWLARADLKARGVKAVFEYDGATHNEPARHASDIARWKVLRRHGFEVYPYTARELFRMPQQIVLDYQRVLGLPPDPTVVDRWLRESRRSLWCTARRAVVIGASQGRFDPQ